MSESSPELEKAIAIEKRRNQGELPDLLDVVTIDGRLCQVIQGGNVIRFLDDNSGQAIDWDNYKLISKDDKPIFLMKSLGKKFSEAEIANVHWGSEQDDHPELREQVIYFGEFRKTE